MITQQTFVRGGKNAVKVVYDISKYLIPAIFIVKILEYSGQLDKIADILGSYMSYIGLPGEGALILLFGQVAMYSALAAIVSLDLTVKQITISCTMLAICHVLPVETAIVSKSGASGLLNAGLRILAAVFAALLLNWIMPGV